MRPLTDRQMQVLSLVCRTIHDDGMPPTRAEIASALGFASANAAEDHLKALARKGMIEKIPGNSRGIVITPLAREHCPDCSGFGDDTAGLPVIGRVAAGAPIESHEHIDEFHKVDPHLFSPRADYLLRVQGDSMRDVGILDGDLLAVHRTHEAHNGQIVVARVDHDEVTVKRFQKRGNTVQLIAENPDYAPIKVDLREQHLSIEGLYAGVLRVAG